MRLKAGVSMKGVEPQTVAGMLIADSVFRVSFGHECTITSINDGKHKSGSLHYRGRAFDLRSHDIPEGMLDLVLLGLKEAFNAEWDILLEDRATSNQHIHVEYDPEKPIGLTQPSPVPA